MGIEPTTNLQKANIPNYYCVKSSFNGFYFTNILILLTDLTFINGSVKMQINSI